MNNLVLKIFHLSLLFMMLFFAMNGWNVSAQKPLNEFSISAGGGFSSFCFQPPVKKTTSIGYHTEVELGFTGFLSPHWGIHLGLGWGLYRVKTKTGKLNTITYGLMDKNSYLFDLHTTLNNYEETDKAMFLYLPVMLQFQTQSLPSINWKKGNKANFYMMAGVKALFLFDNQYDGKVKSLYNAAYYPEFDNWANTQIFAGLSTFDGNKVDGKFKLNMLVMFAFETGIKWRIGNTLFLYSGVYYDCGLNNPSKKIRKPFEYYIYEEHLTNFTLLKLSNKMNLMTVGIKFRLAFFRIPKITSCPYH